MPSIKNICQGIIAAVRMHRSTEYFLEWCTIHFPVTEQQTKAIHLITNFNKAHTINILEKIADGMKPTIACQWYLKKYPGAGEEVMKTFSKLDEI